jgi:hypothetical protein
LPDFAAREDWSAEEDSAEEDLAAPYLAVSGLATRPEPGLPFDPAVWRPLGLASRVGNFDVAGLVFRTMALL